jgi:hypothetical protein
MTAISMCCRGAALTCGNETAELFNDRFSLALPKDHPLASSAK